MLVNLLPVRFHSEAEGHQFAELGSEDAPDASERKTSRHVRDLRLTSGGVLPSSYLSAYSFTVTRIHENKGNKDRSVDP